jgi:hypothetical protein
MPPRSNSKRRNGTARPNTFASPYSAPDPAKRADAAHYMGQMLIELIRMARLHRFELLAYLLDMARLEARTAARAHRPPE